MSHLRMTKNKISRNFLAFYLLRNESPFEDMIALLCSQNLFGMYSKTNTNDEDLVIRCMAPLQFGIYLAWNNLETFTSFY